jgi:hypothetical protein
MDTMLSAFMYLFHFAHTWEAEGFPVFTNESELLQKLVSGGLWIQILVFWLQSPWSYSIYHTNIKTKC